MTFHVGQKVVCVDASLPQNPWHCQYPLVLRKIYTVHGHAQTQPSRPACMAVDGSGRVWECFRFRPIVERKTDISVFTAMLTDQKIGADA
jgi:hypothetical protein